ncbi:uncharacterized protein LOC132868992 [Neoarius graeffei]|uniref:uncharacterized protein LOC132868992 n=1 Tax=Neoarius graeffei TaxID=443677 RepID=UPI00298C0AC3|nr:uncharacterized protein LOC132868992 [Neoarius graeffei]
MQVCFLLLVIHLHITEGCRLEGNEGLIEITAYTGDSVLLPCSCTDLQTTPETFTWEKHITHENNWVKISPESEQDKERFQLVNDRSSGNLSLLISHLTEEDGGYYRCYPTQNEYRDIRLTVKGCTLNLQTVYVTGYVGQSVLLPCSCSELQAKPHNFTWTFLNGSPHKEIFPEDQTNLYTDRVQLFNDHLPGNLSLLVSHLTVEDGGRYRCEIRNRISDVRLTVRDAPTKPSTSAPVTTTTSSHSKPEHLPYVPFAVVTVFFLHIIVAVVYYTTRKKETPTNPNPRNIIIIICTAVGVLLLLLLGGVMYWKQRGCRLEGNKKTIGITAYTGDSVLLPCSCTYLQTTPEYKERYQLVNDRSSGNLSLLISHLTEEDGGVYSCSVQGSQYRDLRLTVKGCTLN